MEFSGLSGTSGIMPEEPKKGRRKVWYNAGTLPIVGKSGKEYLPGDQIYKPKVEFGPHYERNFPMIQPV